MIRPNSLQVWVGVACFLALHALLALWAASKESVTADEILHVTGGYFYNKFGDYRIQPENGNLPQRWAALPAWINDAPTPRLDNNSAWQNSDASLVGYQFFYMTGHDHWPMLMAGRFMITLFSLCTGLIIFFWSRELWGTAGGFFSLIFYCLDPNILAHAPLATSDTTAVFFLLATCGAFWRYLQTPVFRSGLLSCILFGLACVAKYSAVLLLPIMVLLLAWRILTESRGQKKRWLIIGPTTFFSHGAVATFIIWAFYGFRYSAFADHVLPAGDFKVPWNDFLSAIGIHGSAVQFLRNWHLLPEGFLYGYAWVVESAKARAAFLAGDYRIFGWVKFFPLAFFWKSTCALLTAIALGFASLLHRWRSPQRKIARDLTAVAPLLILFLVYWGFSLSSHLNIGHRHILPVYPVLFILVGALAIAPSALWQRWSVLAVLVAGQLTANIGVSPHYLAFFNSLAGGPENGWRLLADSSLDWGQDLPGLAKWLEKNNSGTAKQPVFLSYFGSGEPAYYGIKCINLPFVNGFKQIHPWYQPTAGLYCISATMLQQVYSPFRGEWTLAYEREYQSSRAKELLFGEYWKNSSVRDELNRLRQADSFEKTWQRYDVLRLARLTTYLRTRKPQAMIGYSILIYQLTDVELNAAINLRYQDLINAMQKESSP